MYLEAQQDLERQLGPGHLLALARQRNLASQLVLVPPLDLDDLGNQTDLAGLLILDDPGTQLDLGHLLRLDVLEPLERLGHPEGQ